MQQQQQQGKESSVVCSSCKEQCDSGHYEHAKTVHEGRIYQLKLFCDKDYPEKPPSVCFHSRVNMTCVNPENGVRRNLGCCQIGSENSLWKTYELSCEKKWLLHTTESSSNLPRALFSNWLSDWKNPNAD